MIEIGPELAKTLQGFAFAFMLAVFFWSVFR